MTITKRKATANVRLAKNDTPVVDDIPQGIPNKR